MSKLNEIPVHVEVSNESRASESVSMLLPILHELIDHHKTLLSSGQSHIFDLRHEPLNLEEIAALKELLGQGEINANLTTLGSTSISETSISGVWWVTYYNPDGMIMNEFIEITTCPEMLKTHTHDLQPALVRLQDKLTQYAHPTTPDEITKRLNELGFNPGTVSPSNLN
jgi:hydrogenase-1 operon protein HyaF